MQGETVRGAALMEEGFAYSAGSSLGVNAPWSGSGARSLVISTNSLSYPGLKTLSPPGLMLMVGGAGSSTARRNFTGAPIPNVAGSSVYCSFLLNCLTLPTNSQHVLSLLTSGGAFNGSDDPLAVNIQNFSAGYSFVIRHHGENGSSAKVVSANSTHLIVAKYLFGGTDRCSLYIDPVPGAAEPVSPDAITQSGEGDPTGSLQTVGVRAPTNAAIGNLLIDSMRIGTNWDDVTPPLAALALTGPVDQAVCAGSGATFSVVASGTPPYNYQWRTNGVAVPGATGSSYHLVSAQASDAAKSYSVSVTDAFGAVTSAPARLFVSAASPAIAQVPANQVIVSGSNALFTVAATGDSPLTYQWRSNAIPIPDATNSTYQLLNVLDVTPAPSFDVIVGNPCGSVTSAPAASLLFAHQFYSADGLPGFFGGMNLILTNGPGMTLSAWSSTDLSLPVTQWAIEGPLGEQPLNDGSTDSRYTINVNPFAASTFYIIGSTIDPLYISPVPIVEVDTDFLGNYALSVTNIPINSSGTLGSSTAPVQPTLGIQQSGTAVVLTSSGPAGKTFWIEATTNLPPADNWAIYGVGLVDNAGIASFTDPNASAFSKRLFRLVFPDLSASAPIIYQQPVARTVLTGRTAAFTVAATGSEPLAYQWYSPGTNSAPVGSSQILTVVNAASQNAGSYFAVVSNPFGSVTSAVASLGVIGPPILAARASGQSLTITGTAGAGDKAILEVSTNLSLAGSWQPIVTNKVDANGGLSFAVTPNAGTPRQFFRVLFP